MENELDKTLLDYEYVSICGKGGFSTVYKIKNKKTGNFYALKEIEKKNFGRCEELEIEDHINIRKYIFLGFGYRPELIFNNKRNKKEISSMESLILKNSLTPTKILINFDHENQTIINECNKSKLQYENQTIINEFNKNKLQYEKISFHEILKPRKKLKDDFFIKQKLKELQSISNNQKKSNKYSEKFCENFLQERDLNALNLAKKRIFSCEKHLKKELNDNKLKKNYCLSKIGDRKNNKLVKNTMFYYCKCFYRKSRNYNEALNKYTSKIKEKSIKDCCNKKITFNDNHQVEVANSEIDLDINSDDLSFCASESISRDQLNSQNNCYSKNTNVLSVKNTQSKKKNLFVYFLSLFCEISLRDYLITRNDFYFDKKENENYSTMVYNSFDTFNLNRKFIADIFKGIVNGVKHLHENHFMHRDLKPENIFFADKNNPVPLIGDFGLAKQCTENQENSFLSQNIGTESYAAPETKLKTYTNKIDVYSLGLIFFELIHPIQTQMERIKLFSDIKNSENVAFVVNLKYCKEIEIINKCIMKNYKERIDIFQLHDEIINFIKKL